MTFLELDIWGPLASIAASVIIATYVYLSRRLLSLSNPVWWAPILCVVGAVDAGFAVIWLWVGHNWLATVSLLALAVVLPVAWRESTIAYTVVRSVMSSR